MLRELLEATFDIKRKAEGEVTFPTSTLQDPHIVRTINIIAKEMGITPQEVEARVTADNMILQLESSISPILYDTINKNAVEQKVFTMFWKEVSAGIPGAPTFSNVVFNKLIRRLQAEYDEFFPLRSFIDKRRLVNPKITYVEASPTLEKEIRGKKPEDYTPEEVKKIKEGLAVGTAAASPTGEFYFNTGFMQKLMDYAHIKGVQPKGKKYKSNGGPFPDEYAWLEFIIMHEFMHYSHDDFYYQKIIPNANPTIINWVGDFRTNYLLVKSGMEALPMGLFNDKINYDRQTTYAEMYKIVEDEFKKLNKNQQDLLKKIMGDLSDDHEPGNAQGEESDIDEGDASEEDLDGNAKDIGDAVDEGDEEKGEGKETESGDPSEGEGKGQGGEGGGSSRKYRGVDYSQVRPTFNWKQLISRFIASAKPKTEETYAKPSRRSVSGMETARQLGAAAIKPAEVATDAVESNMCFLVDSSGSMTSVIEKVFSNIVGLLKQAQFRKVDALLIKFSDKYDMYKVNFGRNKAAKVTTVTEKPKQYPLKAQAVLNEHLGYGTSISNALIGEIGSAVANKYNCVAFMDGDALYGDNFENTKKMVMSNPKQVFIIFDSRDTYISFRQKAGISTPNVTYFQ